MIESLDIEEQIIDILSKTYEIEKQDDDNFDLSDETHLCLLIKDKDFQIKDIREMVKDLDVRVIRYANIVGFCYN